jgi:hypothetical protein
LAFCGPLTVYAAMCGAAVGAGAVAGAAEAVVAGPVERRAPSLARAALVASKVPPTRSAWGTT